MIKINNQFVKYMYQQKKLKLIISSLKQKELIQFFQLYVDYFAQDIRKNIKKISFNCYETTIEYRNIVVNGYGKNYNDALVAGIANFMDKILTDEKCHPTIKDCIKKYTNTNNIDACSNQKLKTQPDNHQERKISNYSKPMENSLRPKENIMKSVKTIKEEIFESLNHDNIQLKAAQNKTNQLNKNSSYSVLHNNMGHSHHKNEELELITRKIKELQQQLAGANKENEHLRNRLKEKERYSQSTVPQAVIEKRAQEKALQNQAYLKDISSKFNNTSHPNEIKPQHEKLRSYSLSNSVNSSAFNSRVPAKIKIPKLNLQILPNYHGKSNKSLNQSLLQSYEKKTKTVNYNV